MNEIHCRHAQPAERAAKNDGIAWRGQPAERAANGNRIAWRGQPAGKPAWLRSPSLPTEAGGRRARAHGMRMIEGQGRERLKPPRPVAPSRHCTGTLREPYSQKTPWRAMGEAFGFRWRISSTKCSHVPASCSSSLYGRDSSRPRSCQALPSPRAIRPVPGSVGSLRDRSRAGLPAGWPHGPILFIRAIISAGWPRHAIPSSLADLSARRPHDLIASFPHDPATGDDR